MKKLQFIPILFLLILAGACNTKSQKVEATENPESELTNDEIIVPAEMFQKGNMQLDSIRLKEFPESILATGMIDVPPHNKAVVSSFIGGFIKKTYLLVGDRVKKGQLLVSLQDPDIISIQQNYAELSEQIQYLKSEYERQETLYNEKITSQKKYLKAKTEFKSARAKLNGLEKRLQMLHIDPKAVEQGNIVSSVNIYAPISGNITRININTGTYVSPSDVILEITNTDHIHLELNIFEKDISKIRKGQPIEFTIPEISDSTFQARVYLVGNAVDLETRTVKVHAHPENLSQTGLSAGMFVEARILTKNKPYRVLPEEAVINTENRDYVLQLFEKDAQGNYRFKKKEIQTGKSFPGYKEILNPDSFKKDALFITKGGFNLIGD